MTKRSRGSFIGKRSRNRPVALTERVPMNRGLKRFIGILVVGICRLTERVPMNRGLKHDDVALDISPHLNLAERAPMNRGLKRRAASIFLISHSAFQPGVMNSWLMITLHFHMLPMFYLKLLTN